MTHEIYFKCVIACLIGNVFHVAAKVLALWKDHKTANVDFSLWQYLKDDKVPLMVDVIFSFGIIFLIDELLVHVAWLFKYLKIFFVLVGFGGSYLILYGLSKSQNKLREIIDKKTNIADGIAGPDNGGHGFTESMDEKHIKK